MKYAYFAIGVLVLVILIGLVLFLNNRNGGLATAPNYGAYQASVLPATSYPTSYPAGYIPPGYIAAPVVWYTAPTQTYYYPTASTRTTSVYPTYATPQVQYYSYGTNTSSYTTPGQTYTMPGSNYSYQYQYGPNGQIYYTQP